jgi:hypothetical protein
VNHILLMKVAPTALAQPLNRPSWPRLWEVNKCQLEMKPTTVIGITQKSLTKIVVETDTSNVEAAVIGPVTFLNQHG